MCSWDRINENRTDEQAKLGHARTILSNYPNDTMKSQDSTERCTFHYVIITFELIALSKNNLAVYQTQNSKPKMVLTAAQTTLFFENTDQMGVQHATVVQLALEGMEQLTTSLTLTKKHFNNWRTIFDVRGAEFPTPIQGQLLDGPFQHQPLSLEQNPRNVWVLHVNWFSTITLWAAI